jgi:hypothetical protein
VRTSCFKNHLKVVLGRPGASLEIMFGRRHKLFVRAFDLFPDATVVHHCGGTTRVVLLAFFPALSTLFGAYSSDAGGTVWPQLAVTTASTRAKAAPTASSLEACWVTISSNTLMVSSCLLPNSWTRVRYAVPSQKAKMIAPEVPVLGVCGTSGRNATCSPRGACLASISSP